MKRWMGVLLVGASANAWAFPVYPDLDGDGFGRPQFDGPAVDSDDVLGLPNWSANFTDCDDGDPRSYPFASEVPGDGLDQDCDGFDSCFQDLDGDGYGSQVVLVDNNMVCDDGSAGTSSLDDDCDDTSPDGASVSPDAEERCDGVDNDCDGQVDGPTALDAAEFYVDADGDGWGVATSEVRGCGLTTGFAEQAGDCDDAEPSVFPGNLEICDGLDNDCVGGVDDDAVDAELWYPQVAGCGFVDRNGAVIACEVPAAGGPWFAEGATPSSCGQVPGLPSWWLALGVVAAAGRRRRRMAA